MNIFTKYNVGSEIFYIHKQSVAGGIIEAVTIDIADDKYNIKYKVNTPPFNVMEDECYGSKQEAERQINSIEESIEMFDFYCKYSSPEFWCNNQYPLTIVRDRYCGSYSGGMFTAWPVDENQIPVEQRGDDMSCDTFWSKVDMSYIGIGNTPQEALDDLMSKMMKKIEK